MIALGCADESRHVSIAANVKDIMDYLKKGGSSIRKRLENNVRKIDSTSVQSVPSFRRNLSINIPLRDD